MYMAASHFFFSLQIPIYKYIWVMISCKNTPSVFSTVKFLLQMFCLQNTWLVKPAVLLTNQFKAPLQRGLSTHARTQLACYKVRVYFDGKFVLKP